MTAVWKEKRLSFTYDSGIAIYSCDALAGRVRSILRAVGARDDIHTSATNCDRSEVPHDIYVNGQPGVDRSMPPGASPSMSIPTSHINRNYDARQFQIVHIQMMYPVVVTPEVLKELDKDKSKRELVARVTGNQALKFNEPVAFQATRQAVTLSHKTVGLEPEECELLEQMAGSLFPQLGIKVVHRSYACDRDGVSHLPPELVAEALLPVPYGGPHPPPVPMKDDEDEDDDGDATPAAGQQTK